MLSNYVRALIAEYLDTTMTISVDTLVVIQILRDIWFPLQ